MKHLTIFYFCLLLSMGLYGTDNPDMGVSDLNIAGQSSTPNLTGTAESRTDTELFGVPYDDDTAAQMNIMVSISTTDPRPTTVRVHYVSSPWLLFEDDEFYDVRFMPQPTNWTGHGKTGFVVDDDTNAIKSRRLEW